MLQKISLPSKKAFCFVLSAMMLFMKYFGGFHFRLLPKMGTNECMGECDRLSCEFFFVFLFLLIIYVSNVDVMFVGFKRVFFYKLCEHC